VWLRITRAPPAAELDRIAFDPQFSGLTLETNLAACAPLSWNDTVIECNAPAGLDASVVVTLVVGGQNVSLQSLTG
jgi:hypothetical protein